MKELLALTADLPERALAADEVLLREDEPARAIYVLVEGRLMVRKGDDDFVAVDAPGACVGEMGVLLGRGHTATVVAVEPSLVRVIERSEDELTTNGPLLLAVATLLARRLDLVNRYLADLQQQYRDVDGGLGLVGEVLQSLTGDQGDRFEPGSDREPDPLY